MNIARMLDIPRDVAGAAQVIAQGHVRTIDVGEAKGQIFFEGGSVGLNAAVFREAQGMDAPQGRLRSLLAADNDRPGWLVCQSHSSFNLVHVLPPLSP